MTPRRQTGFPLSVRVLIIGRARGLCECCGEAKPSMHAHHRRCRGMGSTRRPETNLAANGLWLAAECHERVESRREWAYEHGLLVRQHQTPSAVPVLLYDGWWVLDDEGGKTPAEQAA